MKTALREFRDKKGVKQDEIALKTNIALRSYQYYETGERIPDVITAIQIADVLKVKSYKKFKELFGAATPTEKN